MTGLLALAFAAGMIAPVNPCGFALLPAWITHTLWEQDTAALPLRLGRAFAAGLALAAGFTATLVVAGIAVGAGARALLGAAPWLGLATGATLLLIGAFMIAGWAPRLHIPLPPLRLGGRHHGGGLRRLALFGIGYAAASLSCTIGVLLAVIAQAQATASYAGLLAVFATYAAGSASVLLLVAIATATLGAALSRHVCVLARYSTPAAALVLLATGGYLSWYWLPTAFGHTTGTTALTTWSTAASSWLQAHTGGVAILSAATVAAVAAVVLLSRGRIRRPRIPSPTGTPDCCAVHRDVPKDPAAVGPGEGDEGARYASR